MENGMEKPQQNEVSIDKNLLEHLGISPENTDSLREKVVKIDELIPGIDISNIISLDHFEGPPSEKHNDKRTESGRSQDTPFAHDILNYIDDLLVNHPEELERLRSFFKDKVVVDMGAGARPIGYWAACLLKAKAYIGVEPHNWERLLMYLPEFPSKNLENVLGNVEPIPYNFVVEDALSFLRRLPDSKVSLISSGLADAITSTSEDYENDLSAEMKRVLAEDGACIVANSILPQGSDSSEKDIIASTMGDKYVNKMGRNKFYGPVTFLRKESDVS